MLCTFLPMLYWNFRYKYFSYSKFFGKDGEIRADIFSYGMNKFFIYHPPFQKNLKWKILYNSFLYCFKKN